MNLMGFSSASGEFLVFFIILIIWSVVWKGIALWRAARNNHIYWYVPMLFINTAGLLEIIYIFFFSKKKTQQTGM
jgi:methionyl-tRNA synthetase